MTTDVEAGNVEVEAPKGGSNSTSNAYGDFPNVTVLTDDLSSYSSGSTLEEQLDAVIAQHGVVIFSKNYCAFCRDAKDLLSNRLGVQVTAIEVNEHPQGSAIFAAMKAKTGHKTAPIIFIKGEYIGGCDDLKALDAKDLLMDKLQGLVAKKQYAHASTVETAHLVPVERSRACHPLFWFPNVVNNYVIRVVGFQVFCLSVLSAAFYDELWGRWLAAFLLVDFGLRMMAGASASILGMIATFLTSPWRPQFRPGPPKQFAAACGLMFSGLSTIFYFVEFEGHEYVGLAWIAGLAGASGLEWALDYCLGCQFYAIGIYLGLIPDHVYRIYTSTKQETEDSWDYMFYDSNAPVPKKHDADPSSPISLKYKIKSDDYTKDDFDPIRHMQVSYFAMPLGFAGLSVAFKLASDWVRVPGRLRDLRSIVVPDAWFQVFAVIGGFLFIVMLLLYIVRAILFPHKVETEWNCPLRSPSFGIISICFMLFAFLLYDEIEESRFEDEKSPQLASRVFLWIGIVMHGLLTVAKMGEWVARRLELEHVHAHWMILPVGLSVGALVIPIVPLFDASTKNAEGTLYVARVFQSFAYFMWITLFVISFFKTITTHNSDNRIRNGVWIWLAAPCVIGLSEYVICSNEGLLGEEFCIRSFSSYYFIGIFILLILTWSSLPFLGFLGNDKWNMSYWVGCFSLDVLAGAAALFYALTGFNAAQTLCFVFLCLAAGANVINLLHTATGIVRRRQVFTPEAKWGPLSFMKLTHEAFRGNMATMRKSLEVLNLQDDGPQMRDNLAMFAVHLNRFNIVHDEHAIHEDKIIFKEFNDWFKDHAKQFNDDHSHYHELSQGVTKSANQLLDTSLSLGVRQDALDNLRRVLPPFFDDFEKHLQGEEDNLVAIGRKYLPLELQKQISRKVWEITDASHWEIIIPYVLTNLPRHPMRVRYLKVLLWALPERAPQIGMIVYRNVDAVMWEQLRVQVPEMIPRGAPNWRRYY